MLRGTGKQKFGAILNAVSYYGVGLPLGAVLLFVARIGVIGTVPSPTDPPRWMQLPSAGLCSAAGDWKHWGTLGQSVHCCVP